MTADERLTEAFERGMANDGKNLSPADRELFLIQSFILDYEMGGLTSFLYNRLSDSDAISSTVEAMSSRGITRLATLLSEAATLFHGYSDADPPSTWDEVCQRYDPSGRLAELDDRIASLNNYGLTDEGTIV